MKMTMLMHGIHVLHVTNGLQKDYGSKVNKSYYARKYCGEVVGGVLDRVAVNTERFL